MHELVMALAEGFEVVMIFCFGIALGVMKVLGGLVAAGIGTLVLEVMEDLAFDFGFDAAGFGGGGWQRDCGC